MIGMHGAMLFGAIDVGDEVENEVEEVEEEMNIKTRTENKVNEKWFETLPNSTFSSSLPNNSKNVSKDFKDTTPLKNFQKTEIEKSPHVTKVVLTSVLVPPTYPPPLGIESSSSSSRSGSGRPSAIFQLTVEASIVMFSGYHIKLKCRILFYFIFLLFFFY